MTLGGVEPGDLVLVDGPNAKGSDGPAAALAPFYARVSDNPGNGHLQVRRVNPPDSAFGVNFPVRAQLVIGHWRRSRATARREGAFGS